MRVAQLAVAAVVVLGPPGRTIEVRAFRYQAPIVELPAGGTARWANRDRIAPTVTAGTPEHPETTFAGALEDAGSVFLHRFDRPGRYAYFCARHRSMRGEIRVLHPSHRAP